MNALVAKKTKVQPRRRVQTCGSPPVVLAKAHEAQGQEPGDLDPALVGRQALGGRLFDGLHRVV